MKDLYILHYIVATSYVHHIHLKVYKLAQRVLALWIWSLVWYHENLDFKLDDEQVKAVPCPLVVGLVLGSSQQLVNQVCSYAPIYTHDLMVLGSFTERAVSKSQYACNDFFFGGKKISSIENLFFKNRNF